MLETQGVFLEATAKHSVVIDCAQFEGLNFKDKDLSIILKEQFPTANGMCFRTIGRTKTYAEISLPTAAEAGEALSNQFKIFDKTIEVWKTLNENCKIIRVGNSNILFDGEDVLKVRLPEIFNQ